MTVKEKTAEEVGKEAVETLEAENQKKIEEAEAAEEKRLADEEAAEIASFGDDGDYSASAAAGASAAEAETKESSVESGTGEPVKDEAPKEGEEKTELQKMQEQIENINKANKAERETNKALREELETLKNPVQPKNELEIDPDVKETVKAILDEEKEAEEAENVKSRVAYAKKTAEDAKEKHGEAEYNRITDGYFGPALNDDPELLKEFRESDNPGEFAYQKGKELYDQAQGKEIAEAEARGKAAAIKELEEMGLPTTLSTVPGGSPNPRTRPKGEEDEYKDF